MFYRIKGETEDELTGILEFMSSKAIPLYPVNDKHQFVKPILDIVGKRCVILIIHTSSIWIHHTSSIYIHHPYGSIHWDISGTGGDKANTVNISTASAILAAACGAKVVWLMV